MIQAQTSIELSAKLSELSNKELERVVNSKGFSIGELEALNLEKLRDKIEEINEILSTQSKSREFGYVNYKRERDYQLPPDVEPSTVGYGFTANKILLDKKKEILELIKRKSQNEKIDSLTDLVDNVRDSDLKLKLNSELQALKEQSSILNTEQDLITQEEKELDNTKRQLELSKSKLDIFEKKSQIWLNILAKESIASIVGGLLLFIISSCLLVAMFMKIETTKIIESAFLLILGYFFGQATSKK